MVQHFVALPHICPGFVDKVSLLTHFLLEAVFEDYSFLDQAVEGIEYGLDFILTDSIETPKLDASFDEADTMSSSVPSGFLNSVNTNYDISKPQLAPSSKCYKVRGQARALLLPIPQTGKMSASKLIHYFSSHLETSQFQASLSSDNITLNPVNKKADQSLSDFQTGIGAADPVM